VAGKTGKIPRTREGPEVRFLLSFSAVGLLWLVILSCGTKGVEERFGEGLELLFENRYEDAESHFLALARELDRDNAIEFRPWRARALYQVGRIDHLYLKQPRRAISNYREALKLDPQGEFAYRARRSIASLFQDRLNDYRSAALEFERLVQQFPDRKGIERFRYRIAQCYFMVQDFNQARTEAKLLLEKIPENNPMAIQAWLLVGNAFYVEGRYAEAAEAHERLLSLQPPADIEGRSLFELGMCYGELLQFDKAERALLQALRLHPNPGVVQAQLMALRERRAAADAAQPGGKPGSPAAPGASTPETPATPAKPGAATPARPGAATPATPAKPGAAKPEPGAATPTTPAKPGAAKPEPGAVKPEPEPEPEPGPAPPAPAPARDLPKPAPEPIPETPAPTTP